MFKIDIDKLNLTDPNPDKVDKSSAVDAGGSGKNKSSKKKKTTIDPTVKISGPKKKPRLTDLDIGNIDTVGKINEELKPVDLTDEEIIERFQDKEARPKDFIEVTKKIAVRKSLSPVNVSGKKLTVLDDSIFSSLHLSFLKNSSIDTNDIFINDSLRGRSGNFWASNEDESVFVFISSQNNIKSPFHIDLQETFDDDVNSDFGKTTQVAALRAKQDVFQTANKKYNKNLWSSFIGGKKYEGSTKESERIDFVYVETIKNDEIFFDHAFDMSLPLSMDELEKSSGQKSSLVAEIEPVYNFLIEEYERTLSSNRKVLENTLPNLYIMLSELNSKNPNPEFSKHISLNKTIVTNKATAVDTKKLLVLNQKKDKTKVSRVYDLKKNPIGEYFDLFGRQYQNAVDNGSVKKLNSKFSNIAVSIKDIEMLKNYNDKKFLFPLYVDLRFSTDRTTVFTQILRDTNLLDTFTTKIVNRIVNKTALQFATQQSIEEIHQKTPNHSPRKRNSISKKSARFWDVADIIQDLKSGKEPLVNNAIFLGTQDTTEKASNKPEFKFFNSLSSEIFQSKLQSLIKQNFRTYEEMIGGKLAYSETVLYRIAKFEDNDKEPIQNVFIPNVSELDIYEYIDTQVKYNKHYRYIIYAYQFVLGNKYWYSNIDTESFDHHSTFRINQEPSLRLVEIPYYTFSGRVLDSPPISPDVNFVAYKGVDNKMLILFNNNSLEQTIQPILIKDEDEKNFDNIREAQQVRNNGPITFRGDDRIAFYETYRLDKKPSSYKDFANDLRIKLKTDISRESIQKASSGGIVDNLEPNKKYYYTFRAIDMHGHISNPSPLYEVEMINEHGTIFPLVKIVDFKDKIEKEATKTMKRFIQIIPTILQSLIDEDASGFKEAETASDLKKQIALGLADEKVWGKNFRIRLTSKSTGRKIEFDINFLHQTVQRIKA